MSRFSDFFRNLFGRHPKPAATTEPASTIFQPSPPSSVRPAPIAPTPVSAPPSGDSAAPWGYTFGPNGKVPNTGPNLGFGWDQFGTPNRSQAEADRAGNLAQWQKDYDGEFYAGPVSVTSLTADDKGYLLYCEENYRMAYSGLFYAVCSGPKMEIDRAIEYADTHRGLFNFSSYDKSKLGGYVDEFSKGLLKPVSARG